MIRLLNIHTLKLQEFHEDSAPPYAIASHRWGNDEATYKDVLKGQNQNSAGFAKVRWFCRFLKSLGSANWSAPDWLWIDTCCIDKKSSAELSEAINTMYSWYAKAEFCIAYLADVKAWSRTWVQMLPRIRYSAMDGLADDMEFRSEVQKSGKSTEIESSEWFTRGWTLQELIAPSVVLLVDTDWRIIGHKSDPDKDHAGLPLNLIGIPLNYRISQRTGIPIKVLCNHTELANVSEEERLSWMDSRQTTRVEDQAYCLLGIFNIYMPLIYGEREQAKRRLLEEIIRRRSQNTQDLKQSLRQNKIARNTLGVEPNAEVSAPRDRSMGAFYPPPQEAAVTTSNLQNFNTMLDEYNDLQQQITTEDLKIQKMRAFWNPLESMSRADARS